MKGKIHPVIIYPFTDPYDASDRGAPFGRRDLVYLYERIAALIARDPQNYRKPITVINRQTIDRSNPDSDFKNFIDNYIQKYSSVIKAWCVDSGQMWLTGLGAAFDERGDEGDVFWLIPGDYKYSRYSQNNHGKNIFDEMVKLPNTVFDTKCDLCIGEIDVDTNTSKELIDTYGTYGLLANWFPYEARQIRRLTSKPRTELFAICRPFLRDVLRGRWYAYDQTLVMLLEATSQQPSLGGRAVKKVSLGKISDYAQGRDSLAVAMQQLERTERVLKLFWRERNQDDPQWVDTFRQLDSQSEQIRDAALLELEQLLTQEALRNGKEVAKREPSDIQPFIATYSFFAIARIALEEDEKALIGKTYAVQAEVEQFDLSVSDIHESLLLDVMLHVSKNIKLTTERFQLLRYDLHNLNPQLVEFTFQAIASGYCTFDIHFYHERRWLTSIQIKFEAMEQSQLPVVPFGA